MSSRALKKLQQQINKEPDLPPPSSEDEDDFISDGDTELPTGKGTFNPFNLLNEQSSEHEEEDEEAEVEPEEAQQANTSKANQNKKKKKRRKKQKINANNNQQNLKLKENTAPKRDVKKHATATVLSSAETQKPSENQCNELNPEIMKIELKYLNPQYEMLKKFGKHVVKMDNKRGRGKLFLKPTYMVTAKERWPPLQKHTLAMRPCRPPADSKCKENEKFQWFTFQHNEEYRKIQKLFYDAILQVDSEFIIELIRQSPYHVDSLIQLSELCKITEDYALAAELIERALYLLESSLHSSFSIISGKCRMDYRRQENRGFFIVLFKHAQYLEARACTRTAFELSKFLLTLDPENDPLAVILVIDYYAIRSKHYQWLVDFYNNTYRNLSLLPNMAYSYAMALYLVNKEDTEEADLALQYALMMFPGFLAILLAELKIQPSERVNKCEYFRNAQKVQPAALGQLLDLYICRAHVIWRQHDLMPWIERNVNEVIDKLDVNKDLIDEYHNKRLMRYRVPPRAVLRHVVLSDFKEKVPLAPFIADEREPIRMHDPFPPLDADNLYERQKPTTATQNSSNGFITMFWQSLFPSFNAGPQIHTWESVVENPLRLIDNDNNQQQQPQPQQQPIRENEPVQRTTDAAHGIELIGEGNALNTNNANGNTDTHMLRMDTVLDAVEETALSRQSRGGIGDSISYREFTQSINSFVDAMRDVLNFNGPDHLDDNNDDDLDNFDIDLSDT